MSFVFRNKTPAFLTGEFLDLAGDDDDMHHRDGGKEAGYRCLAYTVVNANGSDKGNPVVRLFHNLGILILS